jgi:hypothetical protein
VTGRAARAAGVAVLGATNSAVDRIVYCQLAQSRFSISIATGPPSVSPARTPETMSARSDSIDIRRPAAVARPVVG